MILFANCKINIGLDVLRRRPDGFHDLDTLMYPVRGLCDVVEVLRVEDTGLGDASPESLCQFSQGGIAVDCPPDRNLCVRAYMLMRERYGIGAVKIHLHKVVPFGAGLGGGSADAAFVIRGLSEVFELGLDDQTLESLAAQIGSDTAFFIKNRPAMASGRGEILTDFEVALSGKWLVILKPDEGVSTAEAYSGVRPGQPSVPLSERLQQPIDSWRDSVGNAFEPHILAAHPKIAQLKQFLYDSGAEYASMSGSGSAVYGLWSARPDIAPPPGTFFHCEQIR